MAIYRRLQGAAFDDDAVKAMATAYEDTLRELHLDDRDDPITEIVANKIIECAGLGELDPARLRDLTLRYLRS